MNIGTFNFVDVLHRPVQNNSFNLNSVFPYGLNFSVWSLILDKTFVYAFTFLWCRSWVSPNAYKLIALIPASCQESENRNHQNLF